jgi:hypothetical protein
LFLHQNSKFNAHIQLLDLQTHQLVKKKHPSFSHKFWEQGLVNHGFHVFFFLNSTLRFHFSSFPYPFHPFPHFINSKEHSTGTSFSMFLSTKLKKKKRVKKRGGDQAVLHSAIEIRLEWLKKNRFMVCENLLMVRRHWWRKLLD